MEWLTILGALIKLIFLIAEIWNTKNKEEKARKEAILKEVSDAIKVGDTSTITAALSRLR